MVLADTSIWVEHFRKSQPELVELLLSSSILMHPFIAGELACGNLNNRTKFLKDLETLPKARLATNLEVMRFIEDRRLYGMGIGWTDAHLIASALLSQCKLWTLDKRLRDAALELEVSR